MGDEQRPAPGAPSTPTEPSDPPRASPPRTRFEIARTFGALGSVGLAFVLALVIGTAVGLWLDRLTGWSPLFFILFFAMGFVAGIMNVYRMTSRLK